LNYRLADAQGSSMSNPLLRPGEGRFERLKLADGRGKNPFAEPDQAQGNSAAEGVFAVAGAEDARPYVPQYDAQQEPRPRLLLLLGGLGWTGALLGGVSLVGIYDTGWVCPLLGVFPAAAGWLLAHFDLKAIETGAIDASAHRLTRRGLWLGVTALVACLAATVGMIFLERGLLPESL
jgi:hypothetical protein